MNDPERPYLYIYPPKAEEAGRYLLIAARPAFGSSIGTPVMVKVDSLKHFGIGESAWIEGWAENLTDSSNEKVIEFPAMCPYMLIPMHRVQLLSAEEAASRDKELSKKLGSILKDSIVEGDLGEGSKVEGTGLYL